MGLDPAATQAQVAAVLSEYGEPVTLDRGGVHRTVRAFFESANGSVIEQFVDDNTAVGLVRPALVLLCDGTMSGTFGTLGAPNVGDTFPRDGRTYEVVAVLTHRLSATELLFSALCD